MVETEISHVVWLSSKGELVIPQDLLDSLGMPAGGKVEVRLKGKRLEVKAVSEEYPDWRSLRGAFGSVNQTTSEILAEGRREEFEKERRLLEHLSD